MSQQKTVSLKIDDGDNLYFLLKEQGYKEKSNKNEYIDWSFRGYNISIFYYKSGKLVLQGNQLKVDEFKKQFQQLSNKKIELDVIGCDEAGKGEFLGPLVLGAVYLDNNHEIVKILQEIGVQDSKNIGNKRILELSDDIRSVIGHYKVEIIAPDILNKLWVDSGNISIIMSEKYTEMIEELYKDGVEPGKIIVDQYTSRVDRLEKSLNGTSAQLIQVPKGEKYLAVAAASILARAEYLKWMEKINLKVKEAGYEHGVSWGYGKNLMRFGRWYINKYGEKEFGKIAKSFFKTMKKF